jgi:glycosyltransferase involved in cell wall biosynthesis
MQRLRILLLARDANPDSVSLDLEAYSHGRALAQLHDVTLVAHSSNEPALRKTKAPFHAIVGIRMPWLDRINDWSLRWIFRHNYHNRARTPFVYPFYIAFEWTAWRRLRKQLIAGEFDIVFRLLPANPVIPSPFPSFLRKYSIPFVIGPINGGLPWPRGFSQAARQRSWIDNLRSLYRFMPFSRSTYRRATAIIAGSSQTYAEFAAYRDKLFFVPENGVNSTLCLEDLRRSEPGSKLELIFLGALVPFKACDLALRAAASLLRDGVAYLTVVGDGPERNRLEQLANSLGIRQSIAFCGMLSHAEAMQRLRSADVMLYPSVREFGGAVVVEALAAGAVPCVADFGGPGDTVHRDVGFKVPLTTESDVVAQLEKILTELAQNRQHLEHLRQKGMTYARECLTWEAKAGTVTEVLHWAVRQGPRPDFPPPKILYSEPVSLPCEG